MATTFETIPAAFVHRARSAAGSLAFKFPREGGWGELTWGQTGDRVRNIACGLRSLGVQPQQRVAILAGTRIEWVLCDLGVLCAGGATTTVYPASTPDECQYILADSESVVIFAEDAGQVAKLASVRDRLPALHHVVTLDGQAGHDGWVITLADLETAGANWHAANPDAYESGVAACKGGELATLIYTSGTTGRPKGVELTHACWVYEGKAIDDLGLLRPDDLQYLWLPLAHSFGKVLEAAQIMIGFPTAIDGRIDKLVDNLAVIQPTFIAAVPRIFEKVYNKVIAGAKGGSPLKYKIFTWSVGVGKQVSALRQQGQEASGLLAFKFKVADKLVFSKLKARFGGKVRFFISGSAPLSRDIAEFFHAADILILEGYGLTETSAASFVNRPSQYRFGTVGLPVPGTKVRIAPDTGEILIAGPGVMQGYKGLADQTAETIEVDADGTRWLRTGDKGEMDGEFLKITDRIKELIKTSGGKYVAPAHVESKIKVALPISASVIVHGNNRNYCTMLVGFPEEELKPWLQAQGVTGSYDELIQAKPLMDAIDAALRAVNADLPSYSTVKKFKVLPKDLSVEGGELTQSLKVKRKVVESRYADLIESMYGAALEAM